MAKDEKKEPDNFRSSLATSEALETEEFFLTPWLRKNAVGVAAGVVVYLLTVVGLVFFVLSVVPSTQQLQRARTSTDVQIPQLIDIHQPQDEDTVDRLDFQRDFLESTDLGFLPARDATGKPSFLAYSNESSLLPCPYSLVVLLTDLVSFDDFTDRMSAVPQEVGVVLSPYAASLPLQTYTLRYLGHEILLEFPLQPQNAAVSNRGYLVYPVTAPSQRRTGALDRLLGIATGYVGLYSAGPSVMTDSVFGQLVETFDRRGLLWFDSATGFASEAANFSSVRWVGDSSAESLTEVAAELDRLSSTIRRDRQLVASFSARWLVYPQTVDYLSSLTCERFAAAEENTIVSQRESILISPSALFAGFR
ncbi:MAG: divergent polysaccharide deacetylase family protein [Alphaproteobacteria bacterium]|nr:divergent polysaccharide deacetylase family protein [Alphaproteobacteria bacterium]